MKKQFSAVLATIMVLGFGTAALAKKKKATPAPTPVTLLSSQTVEELMKTAELHNCYTNSEEGAKKRIGKVVVDLDVGMRGEVNSYTLNKPLTNLAVTTGECVIKALKNLRIPFESKERGQKVMAIFKFN